MKKNFFVFALPSGLRILLVPIEGAKSVTVLGIVKTGSRYETPKEEGLAHFYEHMLFKGTQKYPTKRDLALAVDKIGAEYNGATSQEYTFYYVKGAAKDLDIGLDIVSQLLVYPLLEQREIEVERGVILEELHMYEDIPHFKAEMELFKLLYPQHPLGKSGIGFPKTINSFQSNDFLAFKKRFYTGDKTVVVITGKMKSRGEMKKKVEHYFAGIKKGKEATFKPVESLGRRKVSKVKRQTDQVHLALGVRALSRLDQQKFAQALLNIILGQGMSSRLFQRIREQEGLCYSIKSGVEPFQDTGVLTVEAGLNKKRVNEAIERIKKELFLISKEKVSDDELAKAKSYFQGQLALGFENSYQQAIFYGKQALLEENIKGPGDLLKKVKKVDKSSILSIGKELFFPENIRLALVGGED